jgi:CheY-like chemotaxis protein/HPt (histidine-containing phosphotransfer) domain-containing protein
MADITGIRILVVDDHAVNRMLIANLLRTWNCRFSEAVDGFTALEMLATAVAEGDPYYVALLDMLMPKMDGRELCQKIKSDPVLADTRLILLTSLGQRGDAEWIQKAGFAGYLTKPLRQSQLHDCLAMVVGMSTGHSQPATGELITRHRVVEAQRRNARILVVEDNPTNQEVAMVTLKKLGYRADLAPNGIEAIRLLKENRYNLVLMDCQMPEMDGFEATEQIRDGKSGVLDSDVPIIAMTANAMQGDRERCLAAGMNDYIAKPVEPREMQKKIGHWLSSGVEVQAVVASMEKASGQLSVDSDVFCEDELRIRLMDDDNLLRRIIKAFDSDTPGHLVELRKKLQDKDYEVARRLSHNIKGSAANIAAPLLRQAALALEMAIKEERFDETADLLIELEQQMQKLLQKMQELGFL